MLIIDFYSMVPLKLLEVGPLTMDNDEFKHGLGSPAVQYVFTGWTHSTVLMVFSSCHQL